MYRIWQRQPSGRWVPLELASVDWDFVSDVLGMYSNRFGIRAKLLEIRQDERAVNVEGPTCW